MPQSYGNTVTASINVRLRDTFVMKITCGHRMRGRKNDESMQAEECAFSIHPESSFHLSLSLFLSSG